MTNGHRRVEVVSSEKRKLLELLLKKKGIRLDQKRATSGLVEKIDY